MLSGSCEKGKVHPVQMVSVVRNWIEDEYWMRTLVKSPLTGVVKRNELPPDLQQLNVYPRLFPRLFSNRKKSETRITASVLKQDPNILKVPKNAILLKFACCVLS